MANFNTPGRRIVLAAGFTNGIYMLPTPNIGTVSSIAIHVAVPSALSASILVKARSAAGEAQADNPTFLQIPYLAQYLNGAVGTNVYSSAAITGVSIIQVPATGLEIGLDVTYTAGAGFIYWYPLAGASA